ncbi:CDP-glycerol glycerophosphotransferase family protein [Pelagibacterales bacterium SAG-MED39]|nr:CDP-glycerol glycerophosphotransferase family protein [Pelagibacterales bacterium SAG-MED39]
MKKKVVFYSQDLAQEHLFEYIAKHLDKKKFDISFSKNFNVKSDIGFYAENSNNIKKINSKLSFISLGGIDQGKLFWPNFWKKESWSSFDFGILPGLQWAKMWRKSSWHKNARPKKAMLLTGWPKSEAIKKIKKRKKSNLITILYAPCFETDNKGIDVVDSIRNLSVNLIIKHLPWNSKNQIKKFKDVRNNIKKMTIYAKQKLGNKVKVINSKDNIMKHYNKADLLITDESSVIYEALLFNLPSLSCHDWPMRINNKNKPRSIKRDNDVCIYTSRNNLKNKIIELLVNRKNLIQKILKKKNRHFSYINSSAKNVSIFIESYLKNKTIKFKLQPKYKINFFKSKIDNFFI